MKPFEVSFEHVIIRFYLMMAAVIIPFFIGIPFLAILALPIFISAFMGVSFMGKKSERNLVVSSKNEKKALRKGLKAVA